MKTWRQKLEEVGGYQNGMTSIPAYSVIEIIDELEALEADRDKYKGQVAEMIQKAAAKHLPAYREQGEKICALEAKQAKALELYTKMTNLDRYGEDGEIQGVYLPFAVLDQLSAIYKEGEE